MNEKKKMLLSLTQIFTLIIIIIGTVAIIIILTISLTENYGWDIPNWGTLLVEIGVAVFAVSISFYFYNRENENRKISDELIKQQGITLDGLNKSNVDQQKMIKSMSEIIDAQQKEIKEKELQKIKESNYMISQFIKFLDSIEEIGNEFIKIRTDKQLIDRINSEYKSLGVSNQYDGRSAKRLAKVLKDISLGSLKHMLPKFPPFSNIVKLLDTASNTVNMAIIDITRSIYFTSKEYFEFNEKDLPKVLYEDFESVEKFLEKIKDTKVIFEKFVN